ncbi:MAG: hypothetical protein NTZ94_18040, partial [Verrucomicrobia bacterium]|nr:hypothetical protein [Verrucomicrobiota bacterium]
SITRLHGARSTNRDQRGDLLERLVRLGADWASGLEIFIRAGSPMIKLKNMNIGKVDSTFFTGPLEIKLSSKI